MFARLLLAAVMTCSAVTSTGCFHHQCHSGCGHHSPLGKCGCGHHGYDTGWEGEQYVDGYVDGDYGPGYYPDEYHGDYHHGADCGCGGGHGWGLGCGHGCNFLGDMCGFLGWGCGPKYWGDYHSCPPTCDPCDCHGNWVGHYGPGGPYDGVYEGPYPPPGPHAVGREPTPAPAAEEVPVPRGRTAPTPDRRAPRNGSPPTWRERTPARPMGSGTR